MRAINFIDITFENCESTGKLSTTSVDMFDCEVSGVFIKGITRNICSIAANAVEEYSHAESVGLSLTPNGTNKKMDNGNYTIGERILLYDDITAIEVFYEDGTSEEICVPWEGNYTNAYQTSKIMKDGNLNIEIKKGE